MGRRVARRMGEDRAVLMAAGVAFFGMFALFPAIIAFVAVYGLVADPAEVARQVDDLVAAVPPATQEFLVGQVDAVVATSSTELGLAFVLFVVIALVSASSGVRHLMESIRVAFDEPPKRFIRGRLQALALAVAGIVVLAVLIVALTVGPALAGRVNDTFATTISYLRWPGLAASTVLVLAVLYRLAPNRSCPERRWWSLGAVVASVLWLASSIGLAVYSTFFADLQALYGAFAAVLATLLWLQLSALSVLIGAYVNHETEQVVDGPR